MQQKSKIKIFAGLGIVVASLIAPAAMAADLAPYTSYEPSGPELHGSATIYGWMPWVDGDITIGGDTIEIGNGDGDSNIFEILDGFFMANGDLRYGRYGVYADVLYAGFSNDRANSGWSLDATTVTGLLTYDVLRSDTGWLQVGAGARYWSINANIYLDSDINVFDFDVGASPDWVDFIGGVRGQQYLSDALFVEGTALAGTGKSDFIWDVYGGLGYSFSSNFSASVGYRGMGLDYGNDNNGLDLIFHGPVAGLTLRF